MNKTLAALALAALASTGAQAQTAGSGNWIVRARAIHLDSSNSDSTGLGLSIDNKVIPELDISYFFTPALAAELVLTYPQKQDLRSNGTHIGSFKHLPPTLTAQYHFEQFASWRPYLGVGVNYTRLSGVSLEPAVVAALNPSVKKNSWGLAAQAGVDVPLSGGWLFNVDLKKVQIGTDVYANGVKAGKFKIDPVLFGIGVGKRF